MKYWQKVLKQGLEYYSAMESSKGVFSLTNRESEKAALQKLLSENYEEINVIASLQKVKTQINKEGSLLSLLVDMTLVIFQLENKILKLNTAEAALDKISGKLKKRGDLVGFQMALIVADAKTNCMKIVNAHLQRENGALTKAKATLQQEKAQQVLEHRKATQRLEDTAKATKERLTQEKHAQALKLQKETQIIAEKARIIGKKLEVTLKFLDKNNKKLMSNFIDELFVEDLILDTVYKKIKGLDLLALNNVRYNGMAIMDIQAIAKKFYKKYQNIYKQLVYGEKDSPVVLKTLEEDLQAAITYFNVGNGFESTANFAKGHADFLTEQTPEEKKAYDGIAARREVVQVFKIFFKNMQTRLAFQQQKYPEYKKNHAEFIQAHRELLAARAQEVYQRRAALDKQQVQRNKKSGFFAPNEAAESSHSAAKPKKTAELN